MAQLKVHEPKSEVEKTIFRFLCVWYYFLYIVLKVLLKQNNASVHTHDRNMTDAYFIAAAAFAEFRIRQKMLVAFRLRIAFSSATELYSHTGLWRTSETENVRVQCELQHPVQCIQ